MPSDLPTFDQPDNDPWLWLEEVDGVDALAWADAQTAATLRRFGGDAFERDVNTLRTMLDRPDKLPGVTRRGGLLYNFWVDAAHPRGLWRRTTIERYREPDPGWDILLDFDALATTESEDWVWSGATTNNQCAVSPCSVAAVGDWASRWGRLVDRKASAQEPLQQLVHRIRRVLLHPV